MELCCFFNSHPYTSLNFQFNTLRRSLDIAFVSVRKHSCIWSALILFGILQDIFWKSYLDIFGLFADSGSNMPLSPDKNLAYKYWQLI